MFGFALIDSHLFNTLNDFHASIADRIINKKKKNFSQPTDSELRQN